MSRNLYKLIVSLEKEVKELKTKQALLENKCDHLETLLRLKEKCPERPVFPQSPWYLDPNRITCELPEDDPFVQLCKKTFNI